MIYKFARTIENHKVHDSKCRTGIDVRFTFAGSFCAYKMIKGERSLQAYSKKCLASLFLFLCQFSLRESFSCCGFIQQQL